MQFTSPFFGLSSIAAVRISDCHAEFILIDVDPASIVQWQNEFGIEFILPMIGTPDP